jgi:hypothetical protein
MNAGAAECFLHPDRPAVAAWTHQNNLPCRRPPTLLCQQSLDAWLDNADAAPELEPYVVRWLDGSGRVLQRDPKDVCG